MWKDSLDLLPEGWAFCDGQLGTPDLREYFLRAAVEGIGETNENRAHVHELSQHSHLAYFPHSHPGNFTATYETDTHLITGHFHETSPSIISDDTKHSSINPELVIRNVHPHLLNVISNTHEHFVEGDRNADQN